MMIHPHTKLQYINETVGYGVFATQLIPKGTMVFVQDKLDIEVLPTEFEKHTKEMQVHIEKYSYIDKRGIRILSWDFAKYVNHCCNGNTMCTAYGFDIALRDIQKGEEITCEYGLLNVSETMNLVCDKPGCRGMLKPTDLATYYQTWDEQLKEVLPFVKKVEQPLKPLVAASNLAALQAFFFVPEKYQSVLKLKLQKNSSVMPSIYGEFSNN